MYVYSTVRLYVKAPKQIAEIVRTKALEVKGDISTAKEKEPVFNTCRDLAIASISPHTHTIRQKTPGYSTLQLDSLSGVRKFKRVTTVAKQRQPPPAALIGTSFPFRNEIKTTLNWFTATQGYVIVVARSKKRRRGLQQLYYKCDRGGTYRTVITSATESSMLM